MSPKDQIMGQIVRFLLVSAVAFAIDALVYWVMIHHLDFTVAHSKRYSFALASIWGFFANKFFTFQRNELRIGEPIRFTILYFTSWLVNGYAHDLVFFLGGSKTAAFLNASAVAAIWNFSGQKWFVFKKHGETPSDVSSN